VLSPTESSKGDWQPCMYSTVQSNPLFVHPTIHSLD
jgi:hypothetical protein